ncbi:ATP-dependent DNA helicase DinG [Aquimonas sp.]|jgi:ATP-dependent DNA helicase DinG|uniref:ATP-dependent DNA helicase DinG n=1 Tax=Aquimonas sp. TaxID=1872588 RepID=UPI0037C062BA
MLTDETKTEIREAHERLVNHAGIRKRGVQNRLIAEAARVAAGGAEGPLHSVVEAPTGTGKSLGYLLGAIPAALARKKKLVVATATVALQQQLLENELPRLAAVAGLEFKAMMAKGRTRYVCDLRLQAADSSHPDQDNLDLGDDAIEPVWRTRPSDDELSQVDRMAKARASAKWDGDLDTWPDRASPALLSTITATASQCSGAACPFYQRCAFRHARSGLKKADVIVTNHALVLAALKARDAESSPLPAPADTVYVFDEAHHLPAAAVEAFSCALEPRALATSLQRARGSLAHALRTLDSPTERIERVSAHAEATRIALSRLATTIDDVARRHAARQTSRTGDGAEVSVLLEDAAAASIGDLLDALLHASRPLAQVVVETLDALSSGAHAEQLSRIKVRLGPLVDRLGELERLAEIFGTDEVSRPIARWVEAGGNSVDRVRLCVAPLSAAEELAAGLWAAAAGALLTSATLRSLNSFDLYLDEVGLIGRASTVALASPFKLHEQASLSVVGGPATPARVDAHTDEVVQTLVEVHARSGGTLGLFSSHRQMRDVATRLPPDIAVFTLLQGQYARDELLGRHAARVQAGQPSILLGVQGLSEGLDLPGKLCEVVVIAKLPFAPPDGPVQIALERHLTQQGRSFFNEVVVPKAHLRLIQSCGRLIRTETDTGSIFIVDSRLKSTTYGRRMLEALPPYRLARSRGHNLTG